MIGFEVRVHFRIGVSKRNKRWIYARRGENPLREPHRQRTIPPDGNVKDFELASGADTLRVSTTAERPVLLGGSIRLHQEYSLGDFFDDRLLPGEASFIVASGHSEPSVQVQNGSEPYSAL